jgi:hypothetical protein
MGLVPPTTTMTTPDLWGSQLVKSMALTPQPPPPPIIDYSPSHGFTSTVKRDIITPLTLALDGFNRLIDGRVCQTDEIAIGWITAQFLTIIGLVEYSRLIPLLYPTSQFLTALDKQFNNIERDLNFITWTTQALSQKPNLIPPAPPLIDVTTVVAMVEASFDALKKEQASSFKSFSEAIKASAPITPPPTATPPKKPKSSPSSWLPGSTLPQVVVCYQGTIDNKHRPIYIKIVESLNRVLTSSPSHKHILVVGVKWTTGSNLVVRARAPSPLVLVTALEMVHGTLEDDHQLIQDIIPNTRWSRVTISHVYSGKESSHSPYLPSALHTEFVRNVALFTRFSLFFLSFSSINPHSFIMAVTTLFIPNFHSLTSCLRVQYSTC